MKIIITIFFAYCALGCILGVIFFSTKAGQKTWETWSETQERLSGGRFIKFIANIIVTCWVIVTMPVVMCMGIIKTLKRIRRFRRS